MSLEQIIQANTAAIISLTEALLKKEISLGETPTHQPAKVVKLKVAPKEKVEPAEDSVPVTTDYGTVRQLVLKLAKNNGTAIRELYKAVGIAKPSELLSDPENFESEIIDQGKLNAIHDGLKAIEEMVENG